MVVSRVEGQCYLNFLFTTWGRMSELCLFDQSTEDSAFCYILAPPRPMPKKTGINNRVMMCCVLTWMLAY